MTPISIVIPTLNEERYIPRLLESIVRTKYTGEIEVIVVDGRSTDSTKEVADGFKNKITNLKFYSTQKGVSRQRNLGAAKALHENIIFLDADTEMGEHFLERCAELFATKTKFVAMPLILPYDGILIDYVLAFLVYAYAYIQQKSSPILSGMCIITTKSTHLQLKGFREDMSHGEDVDYGIRAHRSHILYRILIRAKIRSSVRRFNQMGRVRTLRLWMEWHNIAKRNQEIGEKQKDGYAFGTFSDKNDKS